LIGDAGKAVRLGSNTLGVGFDGFGLFQTASKVDRITVAQDHHKVTMKLTPDDPVVSVPPLSRRIHL